MTVVCSKEMTQFWLEDKKVREVLKYYLFRSTFRKQHGPSFNGSLRMRGFLCLILNIDITILTQMSMMGDKKMQFLSTWRRRDLEFLSRLNPKGCIFRSVNLL